MIVDCCAQLRSYEKFYGFVAERICFLNDDFIPLFAQILCESYDAAHHLETIKIRNISRFYAHLMSRKSVNWSQCLKCVHITEHDTTSSQRIMLKILFQELAANLSIEKLKKYLQGEVDENDEEFEPLEDHVRRRIFPFDDPRDTRFSINFFTAIDLGPLT